MKLKHLLYLMLGILTFSVCGCGSGGAGLNGGIDVTASATGSVITATATYTNPSTTNLIGVPITFTAVVGGESFPLGTFNTNNSGEVGIAFTPAPFTGTQTVTIVATSDKLSDFATVSMTGSSLTLTAPPAITLTTSQPAGTAVPFTIPPTVAFATLVDPFSTSLSGHVLTITASAVSTNPADTLNVPATTSTGSAGTAAFPGATGTLVTPASGSETMTITWTVTDTVTGLTASGVNTVTLTKTA